jgi:hypothetical protein
MIGSVTWGEPDAIQTTAVLGDDGKFTVTRSLGGESFVDTDAGFMMDIWYEGSYRGPSDGAFGLAILADLANRYGGVVTLEPKTPAPEGVEY